LEIKDGKKLIESIGYDLAVMRSKLVMREQQDIADTAISIIEANLRELHPFLDYWDGWRKTCGYKQNLSDYKR